MDKGNYKSCIANVSKDNDVVGFELCKNSDA